MEELKKIRSQVHEEQTRLLNGFIDTTNGIDCLRRILELIDSILLAETQTREGVRRGN